MSSDIDRIRQIQKTYRNHIVDVFERLARGETVTYQQAEKIKADADAENEQTLLALINEARVDEIVRVLQQPYISAHLYGQARIAQLKPDTTLERGKR